MKTKVEIGYKPERGKTAAQKEKFTINMLENSDFQETISGKIRNVKSMRLYFGTDKDSRMLRDRVIDCLESNWVIIHEARRLNQSKSHSNC